MHLLLKAINANSLNEHLNISINNTYITIYRDENRTNGIIGITEDAGLYTFVHNNDFKFLVGGNVNLKISINGNDYYCYVNRRNLFRLKKNFKQLWIQDKNNIMWLINILVAILAISATLCKLFIVCK